MTVVWSRIAAACLAVSVAVCVLFLSGAAMAQTAGVTVDPTALEVEEGRTATYTVKLMGKQPTASVTITVSKSAGGDGDLSADTDTGTMNDQDTLTFTTMDWNMEKTVTVSAAQDGDMAAGTAMFTHAAASTDTDYNDISIANVTATEVDDEAGICGRTKAVRDRLVELISGASTCAIVTTTQLATVTELGLQNKGITSLRANDFDYLTMLTTLTLDSNQLTSLPNLSQLTTLTRLGLFGNRLTSLPDLSQLTNLTSLTARNNRLTSLPDLSQLTNLTNLDVQENRLTSLPDLSKLTALTGLFVQRNRLTSLPDLSKNTKLRILDVGENLLTSLPDLSKNTKLTKLDVQRNRLTSLPDLSKNTELDNLEVYKNRLTSLPDLSKLTKLNILSVGENLLTSLPDLSKNTKLSILFVHENQLTSRPDLTGLTALTRLALSSNRLTTLPDLTGLTALTHLWVHENPLSNLSALTLTDSGGDAIALNETFAGDTTAYTATVGSGINSVKVTPTAADTGVMPTGLSARFPAPTIKAGPRGGTLTPVASGSESDPIPLSSSCNVVIDIQVSGRAAAGSRFGVRGMNTYTITATNDNDCCDDRTEIVGGDRARYSIPQNTRRVTRLRVTGPPACQRNVVWGIEGGHADSDKFTIDQDGTLSFKQAPDYEKPTDEGDTPGNNTYVVGVYASSITRVGEADEQAITVTVLKSSGGGTGGGAPGGGTGGGAPGGGGSDDDEPPAAPTVSLSLSPNPVEEGNPVTVRATLSRALPTATYPVNIPLALTPGTAESTDYGTLENIMITSGTSGTGTISTTDDTEDENDETFTVSLGELPQTVTEGVPDSVQVTITDDDEEDICAFSQVTEGDDQSLRSFVECAAETLRASDTLEKTSALLSQFRDDEGNWSDGRTYLVLLTSDGEVHFHANDSDLEGNDWSGFVLCEGEEEMSVLDLEAGEGCFIGHEGVRSGYAHAFSAMNVDERGGEEFVLLGGFDETPSAEEPTGGSDGGGGGCAVAGSGGGSGLFVAALVLLLAVLLGRRRLVKDMARACLGSSRSGNP